MVMWLRENGPEGQHELSFFFWSAPGSYFGKHPSLPPRWKLMPPPTSLSLLCSSLCFSFLIGFLSPKCLVSLSCKTGQIFWGEKNTSPNPIQRGCSFHALALNSNPPLPQTLCHDPSRCFWGNKFFPLSLERCSKSIIPSSLDLTGRC